MSAVPEDNNSQLEQSGASDASLQSVHAELAHKKPERKEGYAMTPLALLGFMSGLILVTSIFFVHNIGAFDPLAIDGRYVKGAGGPVAKIDPKVVGKSLYNGGGSCVSCHLPGGTGIPAMYPPLAGSDWVTGSEERLIRTVLHGLTGEINVSGQKFNSPVQMPGFGQGQQYNWTDDKVAAVLTYIRSEWGNNAAPVTPEKVAEIRGKENRGANKPWTAAELEPFK